MRRPIAILLADAHLLAREGVKRILQARGEFEVVAEAASGPEMLEGLRANDPGVVLLDFDLPPKGGLTTLLDLHHTKPRLRVLMLGPGPDHLFGPRALQAGAAGYVTPDFTPEQLQDAIRRVSGGGTYLSRELGGRLASRPTGDARPPHERLSHREFDVMRRLAAGQPVRAIAGDLGLSVKTVATHRARILDKMGLRSNAELIQYAMREGLVG